ncbi:hypothetical protein D7Y24_13575 [Stenotrophomonas maltophilia]|nr:hypothetical protein [Stenotrophomonas maltophilia]PSD17991.1 hypothetical protein C7E19_04215 [Stenotrophomonas maltophilia]HDS1835379.1 hypothetical protein [Stenotrophomonas maltophilia]
MGGQWVGLNLGVTDGGGEQPEPVVRGIVSSTSICWEPARRLGRLVSIGWGEAGRLTSGVGVSWREAVPLRQSKVLAWDLAPRQHAHGQMRWRGSMVAAAATCAEGWGALGLTKRQLYFAWRQATSAASVGASTAWRSLARAAAASRFTWHRSSPAAIAAISPIWRHPALGYRSSRLPWGPARGIPWGVRPKHGLDPEPENPFPRGDHVGLNLGCPVVGVLGLVPLNLGVAACYVVRPQRRTYVVINAVSLVRLPDRVPIEVTRISLGASRGTWGWTFDIELADPQQLALLKPTAAGPRQFEVNLNGYVWTGIIESFQKQREFNGGGVRLSGRSRTALLAAPYAPARVKATTEERSMAQLVAEELADTGFTSTYDTVDWNVPAGAWFYDASTPLDAISALAEASGGVVQSDPAAPSMRVRAAYPVSPWDWRTTQPDHVLQEDIVLTESLQMRSAPLYDAVVVTGELAGKGVTCKVRKSGEEGRLYAQQVSSPLITVPAAGAERGRNILCDRGEQAAVDLTVPLFAKPLKAGEVGLLLPLDLVEVVGADGTWHGQCESLRIEVSADDRAVVIEQTATLERHYTDAD